VTLALCVHDYFFVSSMAFPIYHMAAVRYGSRILLRVLVV
jgi:hypothetical protein